ncbi:hypothetical protein KCM76_22890 [Zooshikella marina]|uniref:hypothetical protein n=1 Tax=Zooshikella ganghwensis TaxID=202772 RepID=UPI001BAFB988|nr:hypothetical protein [Zooshikella ganghwensis]MBU2708859.1 hypothetical protein [Zooshikella ganghwensis]
MPTPEQKERIGALLSLLSGDSSFYENRNKMTDNFIVDAEKAILRQRNCINNTGRFIALMKCMPKSANVAGWLTKCAASSFDQFLSEYKGGLKTNALCSVGMRSSWEDLRVTLIMGF